MNPPPPPNLVFPLLKDPPPVVDPPTAEYSFALNEYVEEMRRICRSEIVSPENAQRLQQIIAQWKHYCVQIEKTVDHQTRIINIPADQAELAALLRNVVDQSLANAFGPNGIGTNAINNAFGPDGPGPNGAFGPDGVGTNAINNAFGPNGPGPNGAFGPDGVGTNAINNALEISRIRALNAGAIRDLPVARP